MDDTQDWQRFAPIALRPKQNFGRRKLLAWTLIGPLNPIAWALIYVIEQRLTIFSFTAFFSIWPCSLGAAIALMRLPSRERTHFDLMEFTTAWTLLTVPIYAFLVGVCFFFVLPAIDGGFADIDLGEQLAGLGMYTIIMLPIACLMGAFPAIWGGAFAYFTTRTVLFERVSRPTATPSQIQVASSGQ